MCVCMCWLACWMVVSFFFQKRVFGSNQKITTKLLACHEICLDFVFFFPDFLFYFLLFFLAVLRMQNGLLFYFLSSYPLRKGRSI